MLNSSGIPRLGNGKDRLLTVTDSKAVDVRAKEEKLVLAAQSGNERAFDALYRLYQPSLLRFAYRLCSDETLARDAVQDAWILTLRTMKQAFPPSAFRARVFKAVRWRALDQIRRRGALATEELQEDHVADSMPETWATGDQLRRLIKALPIGEGEAVYLFYLEDLSVAEIALIQAVPVGTVKSRLARARDRLRQQIEPPGDSTTEADENSPRHDKVKLEIVR